MEREDFLALLDVMRLQEAYAPPPIDKEKLAKALVTVLTPKQGRECGTGLGAFDT